mmetsp:Transcript_5772/g.10004  ORF Transcript_5772/g.10004 Transcript_5772/m.10004 type:complete len:310 (+) Transcript_5772:88-1017(+)|eukprot:CAMPEP_0119100964 /NCGR_PEP_ID=MMETSP1180-20130426/80_1 /TAXON_ID=3052 ORGANISM="Chlamydomonas cf sp, Strain CCMP681" /NCGR_SAMPLE_ID=MMETSP1180 /ASSEMBLY_ACC=CAM_ASM_000741 /LENGTH=309 /DNA_ID=CAMNT_0007084961 /DNA_START=73 /DNA_END=1002 /DNA_ORIENTATION=+
MSPVLPAAIPFDPVQLANAARKAMKGMGTDDKALIQCIAPWNNEQLQVLRQAYQGELKRDLVEDVKSETSGAYEKGLVGALLTRSEWDAKCLNSFMKGVGTNEKGMIETLAHRDRQEIEGIKEAYLRMYGKTLQHDIEGDTSGLTKRFFVALINSPRQDGNVSQVEVSQDISDLYQAGNKFFTDDSTFVDVITKHGNDYLKALNVAYGRACGDTLVHSCTKELGGWIEDGLIAMITDHDTYYAQLLFKAMDGAGTDEDTLVRIITSRRHRLFWINNKYMEMYGKNLYHRVQNEVSGDLSKVLQGLMGGI